MSLTSSKQLVAEILQQPQPPCMAKYIDKLAATIIESRGGYMEDDVWDAYEKLKVVPRDTIQVREILTFCELNGAPVRIHGLMHEFMFRKTFRSSPIGNSLSSYSRSKLPSHLSQAPMGPPRFQSRHSENRLPSTKPETSNGCQYEGVSFDVCNGNQDDDASFDIGNGI